MLTSLLLILQCINTGQSDIKTIELYEDQNDLIGQLLVKETTPTGGYAFHSIDTHEWREKGRAELSRRFGYSRTLIREQNHDSTSWLIMRADECSETFHFVSCTLPSQPAN